MKVKFSVPVTLALALATSVLTLNAMPIAAQEKRSLVVGSEQDHPPSAVGC